MDWPRFQNGLRLIALEKRLCRCALKIFAESPEALEHPKPRASKAMCRQRLLAVEVDGLYMRRLATVARKVSLRRVHNP